MTVRAAWLPPTGQTRADTRLASSAQAAPAGPLTTQHGCTPGGLGLTGLTGADAMKCVIGTGRATVPRFTASRRSSVAPSTGYRATASAARA